jgi:hypothetical protein
VAGHKKQVELTDLCGWFRSPNQRRKDRVQLLPKTLMSGVSAH